MSKLTLAGAASLLAAPVIVIAGVLVSSTLSDDAADQVAAFRDHHGAMVTGAVLQGISIVLLISGAAWLAVALARRARALAVGGGILAVLGSLPVVFDDGVHAAVAALASGVAPDQAAALIDRIQSSAAVKVVEPFSLVGDLGIALLGVAAAKAGAPRWTALAVALGAFGEGAGFATGAKPLVVAGFALLFAGLVVVVRAVAAQRRSSVLGTQLDVQPA